MRKKLPVIVICTLILVTTSFLNLKAQNLMGNPDLDAKVKKFLKDREGQWHDLNIPSVDGQILYDIIVKNNFKSALEIGTSTGHSGIWIAWALSKTGGKLITIEIDEERRFTAHNISERKSSIGRKSGQDIFLEYVRSLKNYETTVNNAGGGISISYKRSE